MEFRIVHDLNTVASTSHKPHHAGYIKRGVQPLKVQLVCHLTCFIGFLDPWKPGNLPATHSRLRMVFFHDVCLMDLRHARYFRKPNHEAGVKKTLIASSTARRAGHTKVGRFQVLLKRVKLLDIEADELAGRGSRRIDHGASSTTVQIGQDRTGQVRVHGRYFWRARHFPEPD